MSAGTSISAQGIRLMELLLPHADAALPVVRNSVGAAAFRFSDAPPAAVRQALAEVPSLATSRPHDQPPASWLLEVAEEFSGLLYGAVNASHGAFRVDAVGLPAAAAAPVAQLLVETWPGQAEIAVAEGWSGWNATSPLWTGTGRDLHEPVPGAAVLTMWWD